MNIALKWLGALCAIALLALSPAAAQDDTELTYVDLVERLTDLEYLATLPAPGEACAQWSSYDRASQWNEEKQEYVNWSANDDGPHFIRREGDSFVFAEMEGPGCIWRIWSARPEQGHVKIYLDGAEEPAVDLSFIGYFNRENAPFTYPALVHETARGQNCYVPIPYQKSCRIVADEGWGRYYHFTYGTFPEGTKVPTFTRDLSADAKAALEKANAFLSECGRDPEGERPGEVAMAKALEIGGGATETLFELDGPRAITALRMRMDLPEESEARLALRELVLKIAWDGEEAPAVWSPLGDFFGTAPGANRYQSLPLGLTDDGWWYSYWYMPFGKSALVELANDGTESRELQFELVHAPLSRDLPLLGRFHAKWHRDSFPPPEAERAKIDWTMVTTEGRGRFCGVMLHVWNPRGGWWGEGDEKFHVDGEEFPSTFGTGSEDYFGYAWGNGSLFENAFHNQTISMGNKGHISVNRWHIADQVPFQESFDGYIEKYFKNDRPTRYAAIAYWYLAPGGKDPYGAWPLDGRTGYWEAPDMKKEEGALEAETLKVLEKTGGRTQTQDLSNHFGDWSEGKHLWWIDGQPGDKLTLAVPVEKTGRYKLIVRMTKANDYAIVQVWLDGAKLGGPIDLYGPDVESTDRISLGTHSLEAGQHKLTLEITGANEKAIRKYMAGLDFVKLQPVE